MSSLMTGVLTVAVLVSTALTVFVLIRYGRHEVQGSYQLKPFAFASVLFCSGLDVGLIMFPLTEFPVYEAEKVYGFAHPLAIELGMWGMLIWGFYFLTAFYFLKLEPKLQIFQIRWVKWLNSAVVMATCAFTGFIFLTSLPNYIPAMPAWGAYVITGLVIALACYSASDVIFMKWLSIGSMFGFFALGVGMWIVSGGDVARFAATYANYTDYFTNAYRFLIPFSEYHEFYLFWWFSWSIMIGQFMAKFAAKVTVRKLGLLMIVIPSIPLSIWFAVLYTYHEQGLKVSTFWSYAMVTIGIIFVVNSLDSLIRLYTDNLSIPVQRVGKARFILMNFAIMVSLVGAYAFLGFKIEHVGMVVICLYFVVYAMLLRKRKIVAEQLRHREAPEPVPLPS